MDPAGCKHVTICPQSVSFCLIWARLAFSYLFLPGSFSKSQMRPLTKMFTLLDVLPDNRVIVRTTISTVSLCQNLELIFGIWRGEGGQWRGYW